MKGKLIKTNSEDYHMGNYFLNNTEGFAIGSTDYEWCRRVSKPQYKLSKQNCNEIFGAVDVEKLAKEETRKFLGHDVPENIMLFIAHSKMFQVGFQKAIEILGDKKFTEKDMIDILKEYLNDPFTVYDYVENKLRSIQQTEWEVEVEMDRIPADLAPGGWDVFPKLDENECLILKRIN
jgi:hypothetical protein